MDKKTAEAIFHGLELVANAIHNLASAVRELRMNEEDEDIRKASALEHTQKKPETKQIEKPTGEEWRLVEKPEEKKPIQLSEAKKRKKPGPKITTSRVSQRERRKRKNAGHGKGGAQ
jgi:hypothetical protein